MNFIIQSLSIKFIIVLLTYLISMNCSSAMIESETNRETSVIIPLLITVLFQIKTLVTYFE